MNRVEKKSSLYVKKIKDQLAEKFPTATEDQIDNTIERWIEKNTWKSFIEKYPFDNTCILAPHATQEILYPDDYAAGAAERSAADERSAASRAAAAERAAAAAERAAAAGQRAAAERAAAAAAERAAGGGSAGDLSEEKIAELLQTWDINAGIYGDDITMIPTNVAERRELFELSLRDQLRRQRMGMLGGKRKSRRARQSRKSRCRKSRCQKLRRRKSRRLVK